MDDATEPKTVFGISGDEIAELRRGDDVLNELISDYQTLSRELRAVRNDKDSSDSKFWSDSLEALHALNTEIRSRITLVVRSAKNEGK